MGGNGWVGAGVAHVLRGKLRPGSSGAGESQFGPVLCCSIVWITDCVSFCPDGGLVCPGWVGLVVCMLGLIFSKLDWLRLLVGGRGVENSFVVVWTVA